MKISLIKLKLSQCNAFMIRWLQREQKFVMLFFLGLSSGLPMSLTAGTLQAWYSDFPEIDLVSIGALSLIGLPYALKWLWAPLMDRYTLPFLGRRRGWILVAQAGLVVGLAMMACLSPGLHPILLASVALLVSWCSASQDIAIDAYRTEMLAAPERGIGIGVSMYGYRLAMLISGGLAILLAGVINWRFTYLLMAGIMTAMMIATYYAPEPESKYRNPSSLKKAVIGPMRAFFRKRRAWLLLLFIVLYKLTDAFGLALNMTFLLRGIGFTKVEVGSIYKVVAVLASLSGTVVAGMLLRVWSLYRCLMIFGTCQALGNLAFAWLAMVGHSIPLMILAVFVEYFFSSIGTVAFVSFLMTLCHRRYTATQFALFSAVASLGRILVGPFAGKVASALGWQAYYWLAMLMAVPGLVLLRLLKKHAIWQQKKQFDCQAIS